jgi:2-succinyl-6-hydroxy-2,4-cyclohexadiene-1-carboxylate synthase
MPTTVVLLHGFTNTGRSWNGVIDSLVGCESVAPDLRGHGERGDARPITLDAVIDDVARLAPDSFTLAGYSMGGRIALHAAFALRERVQRLVLVGASPGLRTATARAERRTADERLAEELESSTIEQFAQRWGSTSVLADQPPEIRAKVDADRQRNSPAGLAAALRGLGTGTLPSLWPRLDRLTIPVELIVGERDEKFLGIARQMLQELPNARLVVAPGAGHAVHWEAPDTVAETIVSGAGSRLDRAPQR